VRRDSSREDRAAYASDTRRSASLAPPTKADLRAAAQQEKLVSATLAQKQRDEAKREKEEKKRQDAADREAKREERQREKEEAAEEKRRAKEEKQREKEEAADEKRRRREEKMRGKEGRAGTKGGSSRSGDKRMRETDRGARRTPPKKKRSEFVDDAAEEEDDGDDVEDAEEEDGDEFVAPEGIPSEEEDHDGEEDDAGDPGYGLSRKRPARAARPSGPLLDITSDVEIDPEATYERALSSVKTTIARSPSRVAAASAGATGRTNARVASKTAVATSGLVLSDTEAVVKDVKTNVLALLETTPNARKDGDRWTEIWMCIDADVTGATVSHDPIHLVGTGALRRKTTQTAKILSYTIGAGDTRVYVAATALAGNDQKEVYDLWHLRAMSPSAAANGPSSSSVYEAFVRPNPKWLEAGPRPTWANLVNPPIATANGGLLQDSHSLVARTAGCFDLALLWLLRHYLA